MKLLLPTSFVLLPVEPPGEDAAGGRVRQALPDYDETAVGADPHLRGRLGALGALVDPQLRPEGGAGGLEAAGEDVGPLGPGVRSLPRQHEIALAADRGVVVGPRLHPQEPVERLGVGAVAPPEDSRAGAPEDEEVAVVVLADVEVVARPH